MPIAHNKEPSSKSMEEYFRDWEEEAFGFGYGTGEEHIISALKTFFSLCNMTKSGLYDYRALEQALGPLGCWMMINTLCREDIIEYGTSPRFGWLTKEGLRLKEFVDSKTTEELCEILIPTSETEESYTPCYKDACNCSSVGYQEGVECRNPFWRNRVS